MALLSSDSLKKRAQEFGAVAEQTNERPYRTGKRIYEGGYLIYGEGDYVDKETARKYGIIEEEEVKEEVVRKEVEVQSIPPTVSASRKVWDEYAASIGLNPSDYDNKQKVIDAVYAIEDENLEEVTIEEYEIIEEIEVVGDEDGGTTVHVPQQPE